MKVKKDGPGDNHCPQPRPAGHKIRDRQRGADVVKRSKTLSLGPLTEQEKHFHAEYMWARRNTTLRKRFAGKVIAVFKREVVAAAKTTAELQTKLKHAKGLCKEELVIIPISGTRFFQQQTGSGGLREHNYAAGG